MIQAGRVSINNSVAVIGQTVDETKDIVRVDSIKIQYKTKPIIVLMLNKPRGVECSHKTQYPEIKTVFDFIPKTFRKERFIYCGRLDKDSQGMLILTNNGDFANQLSHPSANVTKIYRVSITRPISDESIKKMLTGITDEGELLRAEKVIRLPEINEHPVLEIHLKQGRKREIRRMIQACGSYVHRLKRIQIGQLKLKNLHIGGIKELTPVEIEKLFV